MLAGPSLANGLAVGLVEEVDDTGDEGDKAAAAAARLAQLAATKVPFDHMNNA